MNDELVRNAVENLPPYIPGKQVDEVAKEFGLKNVIKLASNENPLGASPAAAEAIKNSAAGISIYPDQHHIMLREALSQKFGIPKEYFIAGNGSDEIMLMIAQTFLSTGDEVLVSTHTFSMYEFVAKLMDARLVPIGLKEHRYDLDSFKKAVTKKTKLIFLCNPNNPTGTIFSREELALFMKDLPENAIVVLDEAYGEYADSGEFTSGIEYVRSHRNMIILKTFSKIYGLAGMRIGYGIAKPEIIKYLNMTKMPFNVGRISQAAAVAALNDSEFVKKSLNNNSDGKQYLYGELDKMNLKYLTTQANFIFVMFDMNADNIFMELMRQGVIIRPLASFGFPDSIRVTVGTKEQNSAFISALRKVLQ